MRGDPGQQSLEMRFVFWLHHVQVQPARHSRSMALLHIVVVTTHLMCPSVPQVPSTVGDIQFVPNRPDTAGQELPKRRVHDVADVRLAMEGAFETTVSARPEPTAAPRLQIWQRPVPALIVVLLVAVVSVLTVWLYTQPGPQPVVRSTLVDPGSGPIGNALDAEVTLSPDGQRIVYLIAAGVGGLGALYVRDLDQLEPLALSATPPPC